MANPAIHSPQTLLERLSTAFTGEQIVRRYKSLLSARKPAADSAKGARGAADHAVRLAALKDYLDRTLGRAVPREEAPQGIRTVSEEEIEALARLSPAFHGSQACFAESSRDKADEE